MIASSPAHRFLRRQVRQSGIPISLRVFQFVVIHTLKGFGIVSKAEVDVFLELSCFFDDLWFLCLLLIQLKHPVVHGFPTVEAWLGEF